MAARYEIQLCGEGDIGDVCDFIHTRWRANHALVVNKELMDWQHRRADGTGYNFLLARDPEAGTIAGLLGFIPTWQFDPDLFDQGDFWGALWKVDLTLPDTTGLGHQLFRTLTRQPGFKTFGAIGISPDSIRYFSILGQPVADVGHFVRFNPTRKAFHLCEPADAALSVSGAPRVPWKLRMIEHVADLDTLKIPFFYQPKKTVRYVRNRYFLHPVYQYRVALAVRENCESLLIIYREVEAEGARCLRIVDVLGRLEQAEGLAAAFDAVLEERDAEYLDLVCHGIPKESLVAAGFLAVADISGALVPHLFEPFVRENLSLRCSWASQEGSYVVFKGDADQDRPNVFPISSP